MYKYEMHLHTTPCSKCGKSTVFEMIDEAIRQGYAGVVFTEHFYRGNTGIDKTLPWKEFVLEYHKSYLEAKEYAKQYDFDVLYGFEEKFSAGKEALIYGVPFETVAETPEFAEMSLREMADFVRKNGGIIAVAHPYRSRPYIPEPDRDPDHNCFDGVEVYNSHNSEDENARAEAFAERYGLIKLSGGDHHMAEKFGGSGIAFRQRIKDEQSLLAALRSGDYRLITE